MLARADAVPEQNEAHAVSTMMSAIEQRVNDIYSDIEVYTTHVRLLQAGVKCGHRCATAWCLAQAHTGTFCARIILWHPKSCAMQCMAAGAHAT